ncbi:ABC transporter ATP-binding protein [uncultured Vagococcus sp.]|uniref:ABC transporter ATP-binding protein n=1 Tax=uncultured Vagococcus sp. TaxID=189676 RepID=UPI0028D4C2D8|nr:ABC transporter ATP-binding protein [uncultured Vagococcus sp.]
MELTVDAINVKIGPRRIVKDLNLHVKKGQFVGIIGANGCGKSTLLKSIYKSLPTSGGTVFLNQLDVLKAPAKKVSQKLGVVGQFNEMSFDLTVMQMVLLGRTPHKGMLEQDTSQDLAIVEDALARTNLLAYKDRSFLALSGGEKQRVVLARTIAQQPEFMILDEPTNHLDIRYQLEILNCVKGLGITVLAALHDLEMAAEYCDYIYAMKDGEVHTQGTPEEVFNSETIEALYDVKCQTFTNPITGHLNFVYHIK